MEHIAPSDNPKLLGVEAIFGLAYFAAYLAWLWVSLEGEAMHWLSMVVVPFCLVLAHRLARRQSRPVTNAFSSVGLRRGNLRTGLLWVVILGLGLSVLQVFFSQRSGRITELLRSGEAFLLVPIAFVFLLLTAGLTEEFLFRGVLQTRLTALLRSRVLGVLAAAVLFGLYHVPYAYLHPRWPTHGDLPAAFLSAMGQGMIGGLVLGAAFVATRRNLVACAVLHALINTLPATTMIKLAGD
jgi:membrane protease YdiL (CAAX protease family)